MTNRIPDVLPDVTALEPIGGLLGLTGLTMILAAVAGLLLGAWRMRR